MENIAVPRNKSRSTGTVLTFIPYALVVSSLNDIRKGRPSLNEIEYHSPYKNYSPISLSRKPCDKLTATMRYRSGFIHKFKSFHFTYNT
ncbi:Hypothetical predicted protein [Octopus vulgaris]|uniref:Uncharacterized protein n=1 Tax=Octopus vulgaris TaxID=6645 RepID=A0AA36BCK2_OCTVU|nr:Hypothetical predicted protein [Octopus vulgaris]